MFSLRKIFILRYEIFIKYGNNEKFVCFLELNNENGNNNKYLINNYISLITTLILIFKNLLSCVSQFLLLKKKENTKWNLHYENTCKTNKSRYVIRILPKLSK